MVRKPSHKWAFKPGMRAGAFGWRGSAKAIERLKSARTEIRAVNRADPVAAAEGVVALAERIWPAFEHIDTSSGALGSAVHRTLEDLVPILISAPADEHMRAHWLERLREAVLDDGVDYLGPISDRFGEIAALSAAHEPARRSRPRSDPGGVGGSRTVHSHRHGDPHAFLSARGRAPRRASGAPGAEEDAAVVRREVRRRGAAPPGARGCGFRSGSGAAGGGPTDLGPTRHCSVLRSDPRAAGQGRRGLSPLRPADGCRQHLARHVARSGQAISRPPCPCGFWKT